MLARHAVFLASHCALRPSRSVCVGGGGVGVGGGRRAWGREGHHLHAPAPGDSAACSSRAAATRRRRAWRKEGHACFTPQRQATRRPARGCHARAVAAHRTHILTSSSIFSSAFLRSFLISSSRSSRRLRRGEVGEAVGAGAWRGVGGGGQASAAPPCLPERAAQRAALAPRARTGIASARCESG